MIEIEVKILGINKDDIKDKLVKLGAVKVFDERIFKRIIFIDQEGKFESEDAFIRLRDEVDKVTLTYKRQIEDTIEGREEIEVIVEDFQKTRQILNLGGLKEVNYFENKREEWEIGGVKVEIDTWPLISTYIEIEGKSKEDVEKCIDLLGLNQFKMIYGHVSQIYKEEIGLNINNITFLNFETKI